MTYIKIKFGSKHIAQIAMDKISRDSKLFRDLDKQIIEEDD